MNNLILQKLSENEELVSTGLLKLGMTVVRIEIPWQQTNFPLQGFQISTKEQIDELQMLSGQAVVLKHSSRFKTKFKKPPAPFPGQKPVILSEKVISKEDFQTSESNYNNAKSYVKNYVDKVRGGDKPDFKEISSTVENCLETLLKQKSAMLWMTRIKNKDEYTVEHSINVSILCMATALKLGCSKNEALDFGLAGILHDIGKIQLDADVLNKPGALSPDEYEHIKTHSELGFTMLSNESSVPYIVKQSVLQHHERMDGKGYPKALKAEEIHPIAKVVAVADAFDAMTSQRAYNFPRTSQEALNTLHKCKDTQFDAQSVTAFTDCVGIYPEGTLVELSSGEVAVVLSIDPARKLLPDVLVILDRNLNPCPEKIIHLSQHCNGSGRPELKVNKALLDGSYGIQAKRYYRFTASGVAMSKIHG